MKTLMRALAALALSITAQAALAQDQQQTPAQPQTTQTPETTPAAQADAGKAVVIVYRPGKFTGKALEPSVYCDGKEVARMDNDRYFVLLLEPGEHRIHMTQDNKRVDLKLGAGEVAFVRIRIVMGMMKGRGEPSLADEADAAKDLKKMEPLGADKVKDSALAVSDKAQAEALLKKYVH
jgi:glucose/arabinose dehydrogenase